MLSVEKARVPSKSARRTLVYSLVYLSTATLLSLIMIEADLRFVDYPSVPTAGWKWSGNSVQANEFGFRPALRDLRAKTDNWDPRNKGTQLRSTSFCPGGTVRQEDTDKDLGVNNRWEDHGLIPDTSQTPLPIGRRPL
jgi:hypothetical protein